MAAAFDDSVQDWPGRAAVTAIFVGNGIGVGFWAAAIPLIKARLVLSDGELGLALFAFAVGAVVAMQLAGRMIRVLGSASAMRISAVAFAFAMLGPLASADLVSFSIAAFLLGGTAGLMDVAMNVHAAWIERRWGAAIMSSFHAGFSGGGLLGAAIGAALAILGLSWMLTAAAVILLALALGAWSWLTGGETPTERKADTARLRPSAVLIALCVAGALCYITEGAMADWSAVYLVSVAGVSPSAAATGFAAFSLTMVIGRVTGDWIVRKLGRGRIIVLGGSLAAVGLTIAVALPALIPAAIGFALVGVGLSNVVPVVFSSASAAGSSPAAGVAMVATAGYAGFLMGPVVIGFVAQGFGLRTGIALLIVFAAAVALSGLTLRSGR